MECNKYICTDENQKNMLCGICIIIVLLGLGISLIILGETLNIKDLTILGAIFLVFGVFVSSCIIGLIIRPLYSKHNARKVGYSAPDLHDPAILRQESTAFSQHGGSIIIRDAYAGSADRQTVSSVMLEVRPLSTESTKSDMFLARSKARKSSNGSIESFVTAPDHNRDSLISDNETAKTPEDERQVAVSSSRQADSDGSEDSNPMSPREKNKHRVAFEQDNSYITKF